MSTPPTTRWERGERGYGAHFARLIADGTDIDGEARLVDVLAPRGATILDAGSGMGRVGAALQIRGHQVVGVERDRALVRQSKERYPDLPVVEADLVQVTPALLGGLGHPAAYDIVVCVGNVLVYLADDTALDVLRGFASVLKGDGRVLCGWSPVHGADSLHYPAGSFEHDVRTAGLAVEHRFGTYDLQPAAVDYCVYVLRRA